MPEKWYTDTAIARYNNTINFAADQSYFTNKNVAANLTLNVQLNADQIARGGNVISFKDWVAKHLVCSGQCTDTDVAIAGAKAIRRIQIDPISHKNTTIVIIDKPVSSSSPDDISNIIVFSTVGDADTKNLDKLLGTIKFFDGND